MTERMCWKDDERLYQPKLHSRRIRQLHRVAKEIGKPMTVITDKALEEYLQPKWDVSNLIEAIAGRSELFSLTYYEGWRVTFLTDDCQEFVGENLLTVLLEANGSFYDDVCPLYAPPSHRLEVSLPQETQKSHPDSSVELSAETSSTPPEGSAPNPETLPLESV